MNLLKHMRWHGSMTMVMMVAVFGSRARGQQSLPGGQKSAWVFYNAKRMLTYKTLRRGDRIMDFSYAGYRGGGVPIPSPAVRITVHPVQGDNTAAIQEAIDKVSAMPVKNGFRGAVLLAPGNYDCSGTVRITTSGLVLRGSGEGKAGTTLHMTGRPHLCISVRGHASYTEAGPSTTISDGYVPAGSSFFSVRQAGGFSEGDTILISRPVTPSWVAFMGMDRLVRNGKKETWIKGSIDIHRVISRIKGNRISVDVPLSDSYDAKYTGPTGVTVTKIHSSGIITGVGIEDFSIVSAPQSGTINEAHNRAFSIGRGVSDAWARNLHILNTVNSISVTGTRITVRNVHIIHDIPTVGSAKPADLNGSGSQILFDSCRITGDNVFYYASGAKVSGPVVLLHCVFTGKGWIQPHQRWATGILVDNCDVPGGGIDFMNRGEYGSGHGWAVGWSVAWNSSAASLLNQKPPGSENWMIGCTGEKQRKAMPFTKSPLLPDGIYEAPGTRVKPESLYLAQLSERLAKNGSRNTGYKKKLR